MRLELQEALEREVELKMKLNNAYKRISAAHQKRDYSIRQVTAQKELHVLSHPRLALHQAFKYATQI